MRADTKRAYEERIKSLEALLNKAEARSSRWFNRARAAESGHERLLTARRQGEEARRWAIEQAIYAQQPNIVVAAKQIADFVYGPEETDATREAETP